MEALMAELREQIRNKKVLILGFGREGRSSLKRVLQAGGAAGIAIADQREVADAEEVQQEAEAWMADRSLLQFITGPDYQKCLDDYDLVIKSPGIVLERKWEDYRTVITSQAELFLKVYGSQTIGITGTKGKSTTTTLLYHILKENGIPAVLMGNIGIPAFDRLEEITPESVVVFEFSCHQLEHNTCSPHRAIYLNLYPEHLDHYGTFEKYREAKENIYRHQTEADILYCCRQNLPQVLPRVLPQVLSQVLPGAGNGQNGQSGCASLCKVIYPYEEKPEAVSSRHRTGSDPVGMSHEADIWLEENVIHYRQESGEECFAVPTEEIHLLGHHNLYDIAVVYAVARDMGVAPEGVRKALLSYQPLPHRLEYVGTYGGIRFYDDSISTICETTIQALDTLKDTGTVLIGGMDRGIAYDDLIHYLAGHPVPNIILMAATGKRMEQEMRQQEPELAASGRIHLVETLEEAVKLSFQLTEPGAACVLSPAAASYGIFRNFEERGDCFQKLVKEAEGRRK